MLLTQPQLLRVSSANFFLFPSLSSLTFSHNLTVSNKPASHLSLCSAHNKWLAQLSEEISTSISESSAETPQPPPPEGPVEIPPSEPSIFAVSDDPTPLQTATSVLLTGAISVFLFRSLRRRAQRAKETKLRSSGGNKSLKEEAIDSLKSMTLSPAKAKTPPSPVQAFLGALTAGVIALILYKFTTTIEAALNRQTISDNYSVRQITVTIRTIINGLCYLATFVFGVNSLGLLLYSGQLAINSFMDSSDSEGEAPLSSSSSKPDDTDTSAITSSTEDKSSDRTE